MPEGRAARVLLVAGEASGDLHGGHLVQELQKQCPGVQIAAVGGDHLRACGVEILADVRLLSAAGLVEIVSSLRRHHRVMQKLKHQMDHHRPDVVVLVDYPGFNFFVAKEAKRRRIPVFFYIAPQAWAWRKSRAKKMPGLIDRLAVIFPFEEQFFNAYGRSYAFYVGHPLLDEIIVTSSRLETRNNYELSQSSPVLVLMPGSRKSEVRKLLPEMGKAALQMIRRGWQVMLIKAPTVDSTLIGKMLGNAAPHVRVVDGNVYNILAASEACLASSGTATLQAALLDCPPVILYKFSRLTYFFARLITRQRILGLPNIILGKRCFPELIQQEVCASNMVAALDSFTFNTGQVERYMQDVRSRMGVPGASSRAATLLIEMIT